ncbi:MAG TPA: hypothetical protein VEI53_13810 [Ktedonobacteraceae bacterium]|nr:hypothetical protein [Ktedonobacteraceae bacterium]
MSSQYDHIVLAAHNSITYKLPGTGGWYGCSIAATVLSGIVI